MRIVRNILLIAVVLLLQSTLVERMHFLGGRPDLAVLLLIYIAGGVSTAEATLYGFLLGFVQDVYTPEYLGANAFTMSFLGFMLGMLRETLAVEHSGVKTLTAFTACLVHDAVYLSVYTKLDFALFGGLFLKESLGGAAYTAFLAFLIIAAYEWSVGGGLRVVLRELTGFRR